MNSAHHYSQSNKELLRITSKKRRKKKKNNKRSENKKSKNKMDNKMFKVKCGLHKDETIKFIDISPQPSNNQITFCDQCFTLGNAKGKLFKVKSIIQNKSIENWPYSADSMNQYQINEAKQVIDKIQQNVISQCSELKNKIVKMIDKYQKQIISSLSDLYVEIESQSQVCDNKIDKFSNLLLNAQTSDDLIQNLRTLISSIQPNQNNVNLIQSQMKKFNQSKEIPDLISKTQKDILDLIEQSMKNSIEKVNSLFQTKLNNYSIVEQLKMKPTNYGAGQNNVTIQNNQNDIVIQLNAVNRICQAATEYIFDKSKKYLIRIQIEGSATDKRPMIGLIRHDKINNSYTYEDNLCYFQRDGLQKVLKGKQLFNIYPQEIELFISFSENKMLVADYPNYININTLEDGNNNLIKYDNLCLGFAQGSFCKLKYIIKECCIISDNPKWVI